MPWKLKTTPDEKLSSPTTTGASPSGKLGKRKPPVEEGHFIDTAAKRSTDQVPPESQKIDIPAGKAPEPGFFASAKAVVPAVVPFIPISSFRF